MKEKQFIGRAGRTREQVQPHQRKIEITASHGDLEHRHFALMVRKAMVEMWAAEDSRSASTMSWADSRHAGHITDFTASNGVRIRICYPTIKD